MSEQAEKDLEGGAQDALEATVDDAVPGADQAAAANEVAQAAEAGAEPAAQAEGEPGPDDVGEPALGDEAPEQAEAPASAPDPQKRMAIGMGDLIAVGVIALILGALLAVPSYLSAQSLDGVAATVNGTRIAESQVNDYVASFREQNALTEEDDWGQWLADAGYDPGQIRSMTIDNLVNTEIARQGLAQEGIEVADEEIEKAISETAEQYGGEEQLTQALAEAGMTLDEYRDNIRLSLQEQALAKQLAGDSAASDEDVLALLKQYGLVGEDANSLDDVDSETVEAARSMLGQSALGEAFENWLEQTRAAADVQILDAPANLPYAVDMSKFEASDAFTLEDLDVESEDGAVEVDVDDEDEDFDEPEDGAGE